MDINSYNECQGTQGLIRKPVSGRPRKLTELSEKKLHSIVLKPATDFGFETDFWTCNRLLQVLRRDSRGRVSKMTVWRRLRAVGLTYQKPERRYFEAKEEDRQDWVNNELPKIRACVEKYRAILYFEDEANISLTAFLGKTWAPRGKTPVQRVTGKRGGIAAMSAITKNGHLIFRLLEKRIASPDIIEFLKQILKHHQRRHVVVVMDQAPPHVSKETQSFIESQTRLHVFYLPSYSPDWNPDEKVWNHLKHQELKGHQARTKADMLKLARRKLTNMSRNPSQLRGIFFRCCVA
jgi:transposase